jgi:hypothetical protein
VKKKITCGGIKKKITEKKNPRLYYDCRAKQYLPILSSHNQCKVKYNINLMHANV